MTLSCEPVIWSSKFVRKSDGKTIECTEDEIFQNIQKRIKIMSLDLLHPFLLLRENY